MAGLPVEPLAGRKQRVQRQLVRVQCPGNPTPGGRNGTWATPARRLDGDEAFVGAMPVERSGSGLSPEDPAISMAREDDQGQHRIRNHPPLTSSLFLLHSS